MTVAAHCSSCGRSGDQLGSFEGYSACCNKRVCFGGSPEEFGVPGNSVAACCWGGVDRSKFAGGVVPEGARLLDPAERS